MKGSKQRIPDPVADFRLTDYVFCGDKVLDRELRELLAIIEDPEGYARRMKAARNEAERRALLRAARTLATIDHEKVIKVRTGPNKTISGRIESASVAYVKHNERSVKVYFAVTLVCGTLEVRRNVTIAKLPVIR